MARDKLTEYSATASDNTVCGDVNIAENSALPSDLNNFAREVMSHLKAFSDGTDAIDALTVTGDLTVDTNTLHVDAANDRVGMGTTSPYGVSNFMNLTLKGKNASSGGLIRSETSDASITSRIYTDSNGLTLECDTDDNVLFRTNGSERGRWLSGGGLTFNGDTAAANALDDYEEGSWTPTIAFGGNSVGQSYASRRVGKYTKVGRLITATFFVQLTNKGSSTGAMTTTGLPFAASSTDTPMFMGSVMFNGVSHASYITALVDTGGSVIVFYETAESGARSEVGNTDVANNDEIAATVTYFV